NRNLLAAPRMAIRAPEAPAAAPSGSPSSHRGLRDATRLPARRPGCRATVARSERSAPCDAGSGALLRAYRAAGRGGRQGAPAWSRPRPPDVEQPIDRACVAGVDELSREDGHVGDDG